MIFFFFSFHFMNNVENDRIFGLRATIGEVDCAFCWLDRCLMICFDSAEEIGSVVSDFARV